MKMHIELDETEYEAFREYCENYKKCGSLSVRNRELEQQKSALFELIKKECPNKHLVIECGSKTTYRLEEDN